MSSTTTKVNEFIKGIGITKMSFGSAYHSYNHEAEMYETMDQVLADISKIIQNTGKPNYDKYMKASVMLNNLMNEIGRTIESGDTNSDDLADYYNIFNMTCQYIETFKIKHCNPEETRNEKLKRLIIQENYLLANHGRVSNLLNN
jgi:hypothetical protein